MGGLLESRRALEDGWLVFEIIADVLLSSLGLLALAAFLKHVLAGAALNVTDKTILSSSWMCVPKVFLLSSFLAMDGMW